MQESLFKGNRNLNYAIKPLFIAAILFMSGCANYVGMHACSKLIKLPCSDPCALSQCCQSHWWEAFHDPQLNRLIAMGLCQSPTIKIAQARLRTAEFIADQARSSLWPSLKTEDIIAKEHFTQNTIIPPPFAGNTEDIGLLFLTFHYSLDFWGANRNTWAAALDDAQAECVEVAAARLILATAIANAYFQWQSNFAQLNTYKALLKQRQMLLEIAQARTRKGIDSAVSVNQAAINLNTTLINYNNLQAAYAATQHQLMALLGQCNDCLTIVPKQLNDHPDLFALPCTVPIELLARRPDLMALRWRVESALNHVKVAKAAFYPNINLLANASLQSIGLGKLFQGSSKDMNVFPILTLPIFDAGRLRAELGATYADYDKVVEQYNQAVVDAIHETASQFSTLKAAISKRQAHSALLKATQKNYDLTYQRYQNGIEDYLSVLQMREALLEQEAIQAQTQKDHLQATINTIKALGGNF